MRRAPGPLWGLLLSTVLAAALGPLVVPDAGAQGEREFTGRIAAVDGRRLVVDNGEGDRVAFVRIPTTEIRGPGRGSWEDLAPGDRVAVSWRMMDEPRKAYRVEVLSSREDDEPRAGRSPADPPPPASPRPPPSGSFLPWP